MGARKAIDQEAFSRDYNAGVANKELEANYGIGLNGVSYWARKFGLKMRRRAAQPRGGRPPGKSKGEKPQREAALPNPKPNGDAVTLCLTSEALDAIWAGFSIETKARLIEALTA
jgi:transposase